MSEIKIKKRNNILEKLSIDKIKKVTAFACEGLESCSPLELELDSQIQFKNEMSTKEIQKILIQTAIEKVVSNETDEFGNNNRNINSDWQYVASRLLIYDLYKDASVSREYDYFGYGDFGQLVNLLIEKNLYDKEIFNQYSSSEIDDLGRYIVSNRDYLFNYDGIKLLSDRYLVKGHNNQIFELPQERFMVIAMALATPEKEKVFYAKKFYDLMSQLKMTVATPTLANSGTNLANLSSCFISTVGDNLWSIYDVNQKFSQVSKNSGALGIYMGKVRSLNSSIKGFKNASGGVIPWVRLYNDTAVAVDQLGKRKGSASITLDIWHKDLYEFLDIRTNNGDDRRKAHDIFPALSIPDLFMKRVKERGEWSLFDPFEISKKLDKNLEDCFDIDNNLEFTENYINCEQNPNISKITVPALDIMKKIMKSAVETGTPFIFFRDTVNEANPNKHAGVIYSSNLCHEIAQNMSESTFVNEEILENDTYITKVFSGDMVTCNLNSLNLGRISKDELKDAIPLQIRMLDNVISINKFPVLDAKITSNKYRSIGLGTSGYHHYLVNNNIKWESNEHIKVADELFEEIAFHAIKASMEISKEKGSYPLFKGSEWENGKYFERRNYTSERWIKLKNDIKKHGIRNGYIMAIAPTGSTSNIANTTAGIDPIFKKFFMEEKKGNFIPKTAPDLNSNNFWLYKEAHTINQEWSIEACGVRQKHIDQAQSFNLYITPNTTAKEILDLYIMCWEKRIKTIYYIRNQSLEVDECTSCSS